MKAFECFFDFFRKGHNLWGHSFRDCVPMPHPDYLPNDRVEEAVAGGESITVYVCGEDDESDSKVHRRAVEKAYTVLSRRHPGAVVVQ